AIPSLSYVGSCAHHLSDSCLSFFPSVDPHPVQRSFPTRRSSDLRLDSSDEDVLAAAKAAQVDHFVRTLPEGYDTVLNEEASNIRDRKSTRLNSSHVSISYAVFCLKK